MLLAMRRNRNLDAGGYLDRGESGDVDKVDDDKRCDVVCRGRMQKMTDAFGTIMIALAVFPEPEAPPMNDTR